MTWARRFEELQARKTDEAARAIISPLETVCLGAAARAWPVIGNPWTYRQYDGGYHLPPARDDRPVLTLVFVQSRRGDTGADDPGALGGGDVDRHLIYEGLSRVAADAVLAGAHTATGGTTVFSVWHPEIVTLRLSLGLPRHPMQIVVSGRDRLDLDGTMLFNVPEVPVLILVTSDSVEHQVAAAERPWLRTLRVGDDLRTAIARLRSEHRLSRISVIGGRSVASSLLDAGVVDDLLVTTTSKDAGEAGTPYYVGAHPPRLAGLIHKRGAGPDGPIRIEHAAVI